MTTSLPLAVDEPDALRAIAAAVPDNVRRLEGAMTRVAALGSLLSEPLTRGLVERALGSSDDPGPSTAEPRESMPSRPRSPRHSSLSVDVLTSGSRAPRVARRGSSPCT